MEECCKNIRKAYTKRHRNFGKIFIKIEVIICLEHRINSKMSFNLVEELPLSTKKSYAELFIKIYTDNINCHNHDYEFMKNIVNSITKKTYRFAENAYKIRTQINEFIKREFYSSTKKHGNSTQLYNTHHNFMFNYIITFSNIISLERYLFALSRTDIEFPTLSNSNINDKNINKIIECVKYSNPRIALNSFICLEICCDSLSQKTMISEETLIELATHCPELVITNYDKLNFSGNMLLIAISNLSHSLLREYCTHINYFIVRENLYDYNGLQTLLSANPIFFYDHLKYNVGSLTNENLRGIRTMNYIFKKSTVPNIYLKISLKKFCDTTIKN